MLEIQAQGGRFSGGGLAAYHQPPCSWPWPGLLGTGVGVRKMGNFPLGASSSSGTDSRGPF